jgi:hypothetical protein
MKIEIGDNVRINKRCSDFFKAKKLNDGDIATVQEITKDDDTDGKTMYLIKMTTKPCSVWVYRNEITKA